jgi:hypothetical protein
MVGQSERLPMMMATGGVVEGIGVVSLLGERRKAAPYARPRLTRKPKTTQTPP